MRLRFFFFAFVLLLPVLPVEAADVCCLCRQEASTDNVCLTAPVRPDVTLETCGNDWADDQNLEGWECTVGILNENRCKPVAQGGICQQGPKTLLELRVETGETPGQTPIGESEPPPPAILPNLNVPIPGLTLTNAADVNGETSSLLAQYIAGAYRYGISITALVATVMFIYGAFQYLVGSAISSIQGGKRIMTDAVLGLVLVFSAVLILRTVNPDTLDLSALNIASIRPVKMLTVISTDAYTRLTGRTPPTRQEMLVLGKEMAAKTGIPEMPCLIYASMTHESGGRIDVIGHDESFQATTHGNVPSRRAFLESGKTYSGATFAPITCPNSNSCFNAAQVNDDELTIDAAPDYGLDWRFSHGIGASQITIQPDDEPCEGREALGRGARRGGKCFTIPELLTPEGNIEAMIAHYTFCYRRVNGDPAATIACYGGRTETDAVPTKERMKTYEACRQKDGS